MRRTGKPPKKDCGGCGKTCYAFGGFCVTCMPIHSAARRFWAKVNKSTLTGCWEWTGSLMPDRGRNRPYGRFRYGQNIVFAHRWSYQTFVGDIPDGHVVMHLCDNPKCVRPAHLQTGTAKDNAQDALKKGLLGKKRLAPYQLPLALT